LFANIAKVRSEDAATAVAKRERVKIMQEEIGLANVTALKQKTAARVTEKALDDEITKHQRQK